MKHRGLLLHTCCCGVRLHVKPRMQTGSLTAVWYPAWLSDLTVQKLLTANISLVAVQPHCAVVFTVSSLALLEASWWTWVVGCGPYFFCICVRQRQVAYQVSKGLTWWHRLHVLPRMQTGSLAALCASCAVVMKMPK